MHHVSLENKNTSLLCISMTNITSPTRTGQRGDLRLNTLKMQKHLKKAIIRIGEYKAERERVECHRLNT